MQWHTVGFYAASNRVEIYRHSDEVFDGDTQILEADADGWAASC